MHHHSIDIQTLIKRNGLSPHQTFLQNARLISAIFTTVSHNKSRPCSVFNRKGKGKHRSSSLRLGPVEGDAEKRFRSFAVKEIDVATLGNICVDSVLSVPEFPPPDIEERKAYMERLSKSPPDKKYWDAGGNCNMAIAAVRLGLHCTTIGHVGDEICGRFLLDVLHNEGISMVGMSEESDLDSSIVAYETLLCWVLLDPLQRHGFCSQAGFSKEAAFSWMSKLSNKVRMAIKNSKILFCNGYGFYELTPRFIVSTLEYAVEVGTAVFFLISAKDPFHLNT